MAKASADAITQAASNRGVGEARAYANASSDTLESNTSSSYERASCEYQISIGLQAVSAAAITPARREINLAPAPYATGTTSTPHSAESERRPASPKPNTRAHTHARQ